MSFFENPSVEKLAQNHIKEVESLNKAEVKKIIGLYRDVRLELIDRLNTIQPGTFTSQRVRGILLQIDGALARMNQILGEGMRDSGVLIGTKAGENLIRELNKWDQVFRGAVTPVNLDSALIATETSNFLFNRYQSSLEAYSKALRQDFAIELTEAALVGKNTGEVVVELGRRFKGEEWKLQRIARTELQHIYNVTKMEDMKDVREKYIPDLKKTLFHPMDSRTAEDSKALNAENPIIPLEEPFKFEWRGEVRSFMAPPDRPNDRAILIPHRDDWK